MLKHILVLIITVTASVNLLSQSKTITMEDTITKFYEAFANKDAETDRKSVV